jgi:hypothetical protein
LLKKRNKKKTKSSVSAESTTDVVVSPAPVTRKHGNCRRVSYDKLQKNTKQPGRRLFDKNPSISDPNIINVNDQIVIPTADEQLVLEGTAGDRSSATSRFIVLNTKRVNTISRFQLKLQLDVRVVLVIHMVTDTVLGTLKTVDRICQIILVMPILGSPERPHKEWLPVLLRVQVP